MENDISSIPGRSCIVAREGWIFIAIFAFVTVVFFALNFVFPAVFFLLLALFTVYFFRNPERNGNFENNVVISPADGKIINVSDVENNPYTNGPAKKISIFMSVFNVHINRVPVSGEIAGIRYHHGRFFVASLDKACEANERNAVIINSKYGLTAAVQIAGLVARRIVCYLKEGNEAVRGERMGLIRFGSRVDLYLPQNFEVQVLKGQKVKGGETIIGRFDG